MPAAVASRARESQSASIRDSAPPAKKPRLAPPPPTSRQNVLKALISGNAAPRPAATLSRGKLARTGPVDESTAAVAGGQAGHGDVDMEDASRQVIEISSAEEDSEDDYSEEDPDMQAGAQQDEPGPALNGHADVDDGLIPDGTTEPEDFSFGERLRAQDPGPVQESRVVHVESAFAAPDSASRALTTTAGNRPLSTANAASLGNVLTQALRTNDTELLETCLRVIDVDTIYATVERLPSPLVGSLLQKLAERLHKKPGRAGMLMVWVQWSLAVHGGYLATQPQLVKQLATLNRVLKERASGLHPLLSLKGRLDMLQAQLELRRRNQRRAANDDEDEAVIYVEGEDDYVSSVEGDDVSVENGNAASGSQKRIREDFDDDDESSIDEMPTTMEVNEDSEEDSADSDNLLDDEAEETDDDIGDDVSEPMSDALEEGEGLSESEVESKPERRSTAARAGLKGRR